MPYPAGHRDAVRKKVIDSARRLFNRHGFDNVSLQRIMAGAGLTHGAFYSYFKSKSDLYVEVLGCFFTDPDWKNGWEGVEVDLASVDAGAQVVQAYLSRQHFEDIENSCPMVALPTDVARGGKAARRAFETAFGAMVGILERSSAKKGDRRRATAQAMAALCIGGMVVARAVVDRALADELRDACMATALSLGGWKTVSDRQRKRGNSVSGRISRTSGTPWLTGALLVHQQVDGVLHRSGQRDLAGVDEENLIHVVDGVEAMRDDHARRRCGQLVEDLLQQLLGHRIDVRRGFVEDQQIRLAQRGAHKRDQLLLPQADAVAAGGDCCVEAVRRSAKPELRELASSSTRVSCALE